MSVKNSLCNFLQWDSDFFGYRIAGVIPERLNLGDLQEILQWCADNQIDCLYFLADSNQPETTKLVEDKGFHLVDIRVTFQSNLQTPQNSDIQNNSLVRQANFDDVTQLREIASINHRDSRFYYDGNFPIQKCNELFALWIEKSCSSYADVVFVIEEAGKIEGYITCSLNQQGKGSIGLVGVNPESQGKGVGKTLVNHALEWFSKNGADDVSVITQGRNVKAQRLYQKNGFVTVSLKIWYHFWLN